MSNFLKKGLVPGKRYRLVLDVLYPDNTILSTNSMEFTTPSAPDPLSIYAPTVIQVAGTPAATTVTTTVAAVAAYDVNFNITKIDKPAKGQSNFVIYGAIPNTLKDQMVIQITNFSYGAHRYYDHLRFTVNGTPNYGVSANVTSSWVSTDSWATFCHNEHFTKSLADAKSWDYWAYKGQSLALETGWTPADGRAINARYTVPAVAAYDIQSPGTRSTTDVTMSLPSNIVSTLSWQPQALDAIRHMPVFAYKTGGVWKDLVKKTNLSITPTIYDSISPMPTFQPLSAKQIDILKDSSGALVNETREYRFSIVEYKYDGSRWNGTWLQTIVPYQNISELAGNFDNIIWSQAGTVVNR